MNSLLNAYTTHNATAAKLEEARFLMTRTSGSAHLATPFYGNNYRGTNVISGFKIFT